MAAKTSHSSELYMRRLYKECVECIKRLDQTINDKKSLSAIFLPEIISIRKKLCDSCEKLLFHKPLEFGRKTEEIVWRKCFYEPIQHVRRNVSALSDKQRALYFLLLSSASGYYINFLIKIQQEWNVELNSCTGFKILRLDWNETTTTTKPTQKNLQDFGLDLAHRFLIYLGDLARYQHEFEKSSDFRTAQHYYHSALRLKPYHGQPHNQLGTLFSGRNQNLDAVFCYLRCLFSRESFSGAEGNLVQLLEKSEQAYRKSFNEILIAAESEKSKNVEMKYFLVGFLNLCKILYEDSNDPNSGHLLQQICQQTLQAFTLVVDHLLPEQSSKDTVYSIESTMIVKIFVTLIMLIKKLQDKSSLKLPQAVSLLLSMYTHFLTHVIAVITGHAPRPPPVAVEKLPQDPRNAKTTGLIDNSKGNLFKNGSEKKISNKPTAISNKPPLVSLLRRRRRGSGGNDESEGEETTDDVRRPIAASDNDSNGTSGESDSDDVIEIDDDDETNGNFTEKSSTTTTDADLIDESTDSVLDEITKPTDDSPENESNKFCSQSSQDSSSVPFVIEPIDIRKLDVNEILSYLGSSSWLVVVKIMCDWLRYNSNLTVSLNSTSKNLWNRFAQLLNLLPNEEKLLEFINSDPDRYKELKNSILTPFADWQQKFPLIEDVFLRGVPSYEQAHNNLNFDANQIYSLDGEASIRIFCLLSFGHYLLRLPTPGFNYDRARLEFFGQFDGKTVVEELEQDKRENIMRNMAKLRMKDEMAKIDKIAWIPVYLVVDASSLCDKLNVIKQLVSARKFVMVVPKSVVDELDRIKKESAEAREAIRWLESQFQRGSKYVRAQKIDESAQIRDALTNFLSSKTNYRELVGLIDCSAFLSRTVTSGASTVVCILTNESVETDALDSLTAAVNSSNLSGVAVENVQKFWNRWNNYTKKGGNS